MLPFRFVTPRTTETLDELLAPAIASSTLAAIAARAGIRPWTLLRLRQGQGKRTHHGTIVALAKAKK